MKNQPEKKPFVRTVFTNQELDNLFEELDHDMSKEARESWLERKGAITWIHSKTKEGKDVKEMAVRRDSDGSFPMTKLYDLWEALNTRINKKQFAQRMEAEHFDKLAEEAQAIGKLL